MRAYKAHQFIPLKWSGRDWAKRMGWSREDLDEELASFYRRIFTRNVERQGKQRWGDKTPFHTWHIDDMARLFPDAVFVGIVRHPAGNVASNMNRFGHSLSRAVDHVDNYDRELARQAARHADRFAIVRYEDLTLSAEPLLRELLGWLGEEWSDHVLHHERVQTERHGARVVEGQNRTDDPVDASRTDKWRRTLPARAKTMVARRLGRLGEFYGYAVDASTPVDSLAAGGGLVAGGADIDARIDRFPDLDLRTPVEVPLRDRIYHPGRIQIYERTDPPKKLRPPPEPRLAVRVWRVLPANARRRLAPRLRRLKRG